MWRAKKKPKKPYSEEVNLVLGGYREMLEQSKKPLPPISWGEEKGRRRHAPTNRSTHR